ncbi:neurogenic locus Notch protein [Elysia marginata]|uniref:Neurogenic locus Notch protein n=1 Tax=Elysia marginata TaxID=1093978 RepID=A0AAV4EFD0_9GAST|nr:neurogenic locus Notch protein [Elysia marginata]
MQVADITLEVTSVSTTDRIMPTPTTPEPSSIPVTPTTPTTPVSTETTFFIRISFQTMNLTYSDELNDKSSTLYKKINTLFCSDIDRILRERLERFPTYMQCQIDVFGGQPPRVNFSLQFQDLTGTDRRTVKEDAIATIIEHARRADYVGWLAPLLIGNLLISMEGITVEFSTVPTTPNIYNGISYNYTFYMYRGNYTYDMADKTSQRFKEQAYLFCKDVEDIFLMSGLRNVKKRYYGCVVDEFRPNLEVKFRVILRDIDIVRVSTMFSIFAFQSEQVLLDGVSYLIVGGIYVAFDADPVYKFLILELFTTHPYPFMTTTPSGK